MKPTVLFLCTGNSCRSQMAEGWLRHLAGDRFEVLSAGTRPVGVNPLAVVVMAEAGIDLSSHRSKRVEDILQQYSPDQIITVCDRAKEACPVIPGKSGVLHWSFEDPVDAEGSEEERLTVFRKVRDEIAGRITRWLDMEVRS